ncbi:hypothetical protein ACLOJK_016875 [Asimina triloba]
MVVDVRAKLWLAFCSVKDQAIIGKAMIAGQDVFSDVEIAIVRATGPADAPIDERYVHEILFLVSNSPRSVAFLAARLSRRLDKARNRTVALKTLLLVHRLLRGGDRNFEQDIRNAYARGDLRLSVDWFSKGFHESVSFLYVYSSFLEERMGWVINQAGKLEPVKPKSPEYQFYEEKAMEMVFCRLPKCQALLDRIMDCLPAEESIGNGSSNRTAQAALSNILRESFQVYANFNEGVTTLVDSFFDFKKPMRVLALEIFRRASSQSYRLFDFFEKCKRRISSKTLDYPLVQIISTACVSTMEEFLSCAPAFGTGALASSPPPSLIDGTKQGKIEKEASNTTPFSLKMETRINTVWVRFDDEDARDSSLSNICGFDSNKWLDDLEVKVGKPCYFNNPFL